MIISTKLKEDFHCMYTLANKIPLTAAAFLLVCNLEVDFDLVYFKNNAFFFVLELSCPKPQISLSNSYTVKQGIQCTYVLITGCTSADTEVQPVIRT